MSAEELSQVQQEIIAEDEARQMAWDALAEDVEIVVPSAEADAQFRGFTDAEKPESAAWLKDRFTEIKEKNPLPPAA